MRAGTNPSPRIIATSALDRLYQIDTPEALKDCLTTFLTAVKGSFRTLSNKEEDGIITRVTTSEEALSSELYQRYCRNFNRAVDAVPIEDKDLSELWHSNVSRFSAYKAYQVTQELRRWAMEEEGDMAILRAVLHKYNRYQAAEYNTAVARARTGKQWQQFDEPDNRRLFPCIKWLPSRSASPREEHLPFYNRVWPKDDPFWTSNQPGTLWNCKCDWEQTDEEPTSGNPSGRIVKPGLDQNPATSGQIFTDTAPYIKGTTGEAKNTVEDFFRPIAERHTEYLSYRDNPDYQDVAFRWDNGGLKATHYQHNFTGEGGEYEKIVQNIGYGNGRSVILEREVHTIYKKKNIEGFWDGKSFEIAGKKTATSSNIREGLKHCAQKPNCKIAVLFFPKNNFNLDEFYTGLRRFNGLKNDPEQWCRFEKIICIQDGKIIYEKSHID